MTYPYAGRWTPGTSYVKGDVVYVKEEPGVFYERHAWGVSKPTFAEDRPEWKWRDRERSEANE